MISAATLSRRSVLGLAALGLAGCKHSSTPSAPRVDPDASALASARAEELALIAAFDGQITGASGDTADALAASRAVHAAHLTALGGTPPPAPTVGTSTAPPFDDIGRELRRSAQSLRGLAVAASAGHNAAILASIAASHEVFARD